MVPKYVFTEKNSQKNFFFFLKITDGCEWAIDEYEEKNGGSSKFSNSNDVTI